MNDTKRDERQKLLNKLKEIGLILNTLSVQNSEAVKAGDWEKAEQFQKKSSELSDLQTSLMKQLRQMHN